MTDGISVARVGDIPDGEAIKVAASVLGTDDDVAVFFDGGEYFALDDTCSHAQASLSEGWIEDGVVECPLHSGSFCLRTGAVESMPASVPMRTHRVDVEGDEIVVTPSTESRAS